jgi:hypothetical protein
VKLRLDQRADALVPMQRKGVSSALLGGSLGLGVVAQGESVEID